MTQEPSPQPPPRSGPGRVLLAGVAGACALGAGFGLWARPDVEALAPKTPPAAATPLVRAAQLQIVVDDSPAPIGKPLEVLPADIAPAPHSPPAPAPVPLPEVAPLLPQAPTGLMKASAPSLPELVEPQPAPVKLSPPAKLEPEIKAKPRRAQEADAPKAAKPKAVTRTAKADAKVDDKPAARTAKAESKKPTRAVKLAKAEKPSEPKSKPKTKAAEPRAKTAKSEPDRKAPLKRLARTVKTAPKAVKEKAVRLARAEPAPKAKRVAMAKPKADGRKLAKATPKPKLEKAAERRTKTAKPTPERAPPAKRLPGESTLRLARAPTCAGDEVLCANPRLTVRERQLQRAYRDAQAAGVPASALRRQQERWMAVRAAAAREAPWAVEEVYEARIAELKDLTREARPE